MGTRTRDYSCTLRQTFFDCKTILRTRPYRKESNPSSFPDVMLTTLPMPSSTAAYVQLPNLHRPASGLEQLS